MKQTISSIFVIFTLLFSMTEISNVAIMGYTLFTDGEKAAHFCTCIGCSHDSSSDSDMAHCSMDMGDMDTQAEDNKPKHCDMSQTASGESVCGCEKSTPGQLHILFNTLDKTALLANYIYSQIEFRKTVYNLTQPGNPESIQRDIFHPPRA